MNKFITKLAKLSLGLAMAAGVVATMSVSSHRVDAAIPSGYTKITAVSSLSNNDKVVLYCEANNEGITGYNGNKDGTVGSSGWFEYTVSKTTEGFNLIVDSTNYVNMTSGTFKHNTTKTNFSVTSDGYLCTVSNSDLILYHQSSYIRGYTGKSSNSNYKPFCVCKVNGSAPTVYATSVSITKDSESETPAISDNVINIEQGSGENALYEKLNATAYGPNSTTPTDGTVTWSKAGTNVSYIDEWTPGDNACEFYIDTTNTGTFTVTASADGVQTAGSVTKTITYNIVAPSPAITVSPTNASGYRGQTQVLTVSPNSEIVPTKYVWRTSDASVVKLGSSSGSSTETTGSGMEFLTITFLGDSAASATVYVKGVDTVNNIETAEVTCSVSVTASTHGLTLSPSTAQSIAINGSVSVTATSSGTGAYSSVQVTATTSDVSKVKVDNAEFSTKASGSAFVISGIASGSATITFTTSNGDSETLSITVERGIYDKYQLVTSNNDLTAGEHYIIASAVSSGTAKVLSNKNNSDNRKQVEKSVSNNKIQLDDPAGFVEEPMVFTLGGSSQNGWTFYTKNYLNSSSPTAYSNGYLNATSTTSSNVLQVKGTDDAYKVFSISINESSNAATITCTGKSSRNKLQHNSGSSCFSCYTSGQNAVYLYKQVSNMPYIAFADDTIEYLKSVDDTANVSASIQNPTGSEAAISYSSGNSSIIEVTNSSTGAIKAKGVGTTTIIASSSGLESVNVTIKVLASHTGLSQNDALTTTEALNFAQNLSASDLELEYYVTGVLTEVTTATSEQIEYPDYIFDNGDIDLFRPTYADGFTEIMMVEGRTVTFKGVIYGDSEDYYFEGEVVFIQMPTLNSISFADACDMTTKTYSSKSSSWKTAGLVVNANYQGESALDVTSAVQWSFSVGTPSAVEFETGEDITNYSLTVTAAFQGKTASKTISGITITFDGYIIYEVTSGWSLVTDVNDLSAGDSIMIANINSTYGMQLYESGNNCGRSEITVSDTKVTDKGSSGEFVLESTGTANTYYIQNGDSYLYAAGGTSSNHLKATTKQSAGDNGKWLFTYNSTYMSIVSQGTATRCDLRYNSASSGLCFSAYATSSGCEHVQVYKKTGIHDVGDDLLGGITTFSSAFKCNDQGTSFDSTNWNTGSTTFATLKTTYVLNKIVANEDGNPVEQFLAMYDYVIGKKKAGNPLYSTATDFLGRFESGGIHENNRFIQTNLVNLISRNTNTVAIIVIISMVSVTAIGGYFFLRKRKEQ